MFVLAVVVAGDRTRGDVRPCPDIRVAHVAEVVHLHARTDPRVLHFGIIAELAVVTDHRSSADVGERPHRATRTDGRVLDNRILHGGVVSDAGIPQRRPGADHRSG